MGRALPASLQAWTGLWLLIASLTADGGASCAEDCSEGPDEDACLVQVRRGRVGRTGASLKTSASETRRYLALESWGRTATLRWMHEPLSVNLDHAESRHDALKLPSFNPERVDGLCIAVITGACSFVILASHVAQFVDEHSGAVKPSLATEMFAAAETRVSVVPAVCVLLLACGIYVFCATAGAGHIPLWATASLALGALSQLALAAALPAFGARHAKEEGAPARSPSPMSASLDALELYDLPHACSRRLFWTFQLLALLGLFAGAAGATAAAAVTAPAPGGLRVQEGVATAGHLAGLSILAHLPRWIACGFAALRGSTACSQPAVLAASGALRALRKAPALALIAVVLRRQSPWEDPATASPFFDRACLLTLPSALLLEASAAAWLAAAHGDERGGAEARALRLVVAVCQGILYFGVLAVFAKCGLDEIQHPDTHTLPPETKIVLALTLEFFIVHAVRWLALDTALCAFSAEASEALDGATALVACCPLLGSLFVARELLGTVPPWALEAMHVSYFSLLVRLLCFLAEALGVNGRRLLLFLATSLRYTSFFLLYGGIFTVCVSFPVRQLDEPHWVKTHRHVDVPAVLHLLSLLLSVLRALGIGVRHALESLEESCLGVQFHVARTAVSLHRGEVDLGGLSVGNPAGHAWASGQLLRVEKLRLDVNVGRLARSLGRELEIETLEVQGVELNFEKPRGGSSNVEVVRSHLGPGRAAEAPSEAHDRDASPESVSGDKAKGPGQKVVIRRLSIKDVSATVSVAGHKVPLRLGDLEFEDFSGRLAGPSGTREVVAELLRAFLEAASAGMRLLLEEARALEHKAEELLAEALHQAKEKAEEAGRAIAKKAESACGSGCFQGLPVTSPHSSASAAAAAS